VLDELRDAAGEDSGGDAADAAVEPEILSHCEQIKELKRDRRREGGGGKRTTEFRNEVM
jgi:hypothetical protein